MSKAIQNRKPLLKKQEGAIIGNNRENYMDLFKEPNLNAQKCAKKTQNIDQNKPEKHLGRNDNQKIDCLAGSTQKGTEDQFFCENQLQIKRNNDPLLPKTTHNSNQITTEQIFLRKKSNPTYCKGKVESSHSNIVGSQNKSPFILKATKCIAKDCLMCSKKDTYQVIVQRSLNKKYLTTRDSYNAKIVNDIIYNENNHIVVAFKDYLIYDDITEFLKRFYKFNESSQRLPKTCEYYTKYSKVFPNFFVVEEKKFIFKNIEKKQRLIDQQQKIEAEKRSKKGNLDISNSKIEDKLFTTRFLNELNKSDSILGKTINENSVTQIQAYKENTKKTKINKGQKECCEYSNLDQMNLQQLVEKYLLKDSQSIIDVDFGAKESENMKRITPQKKPEEVVVQNRPSAFLLSPKKDIENIVSRNQRIQCITEAWTSPKQVATIIKNKQLAQPKTCTQTVMQNKKPMRETRSKSQDKYSKVSRRLVPNGSQKDLKTNQQPERDKKLVRPGTSMGLRTEQKKLKAGNPIDSKPKTTKGLLSKKENDATSFSKMTRSSTQRQLDTKNFAERKKQLAIDIETLNKNLQKQRETIETHSIKTTGNAKSNDQKLFKSDYLNSLAPRTEKHITDTNPTEVGKIISNRSIY